MPKRLLKQSVIHNSSLILTLEKQHKAIMLKYIVVFEFAKEKEYAKLIQSLEEFCDMLSEHFKCERELYIYLMLIKNNDKATFHGVKTEMKKIAMNIRSIINIHRNTPITDATINKFTKDFSSLGEDLMERMRYERKYLFEDYSSSA